MLRKIQFAYILLFLPAIFGLVLIGEGLSRVFDEEIEGWGSVLLGILVVGVVVFAYLFFFFNF